MYCCNPKSKCFSDQGGRIMRKIENITSEFDKGYEYGKSIGITDIFYEIDENCNFKEKDKILKHLKRKYAEYIRDFGNTKPTKYEKKFCFLFTYHYRGYDIDVFDDDYGQQYYFYFNGHQCSCGAYNLDYESCIKYEVDNFLDIIHIFKDEKGHCVGAELRFIDNEHTKASLQFRLEELQVFNMNEISKENAVAESRKILNSLFDSDDFKKSEAERLRKINLSAGSN